MQLALTGDPMSAKRLHELGLVNVLSKPGSSLRAGAGTHTIGVNAPLSVEVSREIVLGAADWSSDLAFERHADLSGRAPA